MTKPVFPTRLLVVDSDQEARTFLRRRFTRLGHQVMEASDHDKALSMAAALPFDLVLLDLQTPGANGQDGFDLLRRMREKRTPEELPILAIAAETATEEAVEALNLGADDCLMRPLYMSVAHARAEMLIRRPAEEPAANVARHELQARLEALNEATVRSEGACAALEEMGHDTRAPLNSLIGAANVLTRICQTPELKLAIESIETAAAALDEVVVRALGRADRRIRAPKEKLRVLLADNDAASRMSVQELVDATEVAVELVEVRAGLDAALATDAGFFDLIVTNLDAPEALAGVRAIRRSERENKMRRTPLLAIGSENLQADEAQAAGADLFMVAPISAERLLGALAEALARESRCALAVA